MVKNFGGNKAKKQGRKHVINATTFNEKLRIATEEGEMYGYVLKMYGNGMCNVLGINGKEYLCHIRNKFRGRSSRNNMVTMGSWVLVGLREWETGEKRSCDLLEIYTTNEVEQLKTRVYMNWSIFPQLSWGGAAAESGGGSAAAAAEKHDELVFAEDIEDDEEFNNLLPPPQKLPKGMSSATATPSASFVMCDDDEMVDIDDI